jgi:hypothetical protein
MAQIAVEMTGDEAKLWRSFQKIVQQQDKLSANFNKLQSSGKKAGRGLDDAFGGRALGSLKSYVTGVLSVGAGLAVIRQALGDIRAMQDAAGGRIGANYEAMTTLNQHPSAEALNKIVRRLRVTQGMPSDQATNLIFAAQSAGLAGDVDMFASLTQLGFNPLSAVAASQKIQKAFGGAGAGTEGGGTARMIANKFLTSAEKSPENAEALAANAAIVSQNWADMGGQDEELIAGLGILSQVMKSPEMAGTALRSLVSKLKDKRKNIRVPGIESMGPMEIIQGLPDWAKKGLLQSDAGKRVTLDEFLGDVNAKTAQGVLTENFDEFSGLVSSIRAEEAATGPGDRVDQAIERHRRDPRLEAVRNARIAKEMRLLVEEDRFAVANKLADTAADRRMTDLYERGGSAPVGWLRQMDMAIERFLFSFTGDDKEFVRRAAEREEYEEKMRRGEAPRRQFLLGWPFQENTQIAPTQSAAPDDWGGMASVAQTLLEAAHELRQAAAGGPTLGKPDEDK